MTKIKIRKFTTEGRKKWLSLYNEIFISIDSKVLNRRAPKEGIKKGFTSSIGWNLGKKYKSIHLLDPLTSIPITGTKISEINEMIKIILENFKSFSCLIEERKKIVMMPNKIKIKCLKKNE